MKLKKVKSAVLWSRSYSYFMKYSPLAQTSSRKLGSKSTKVSVKNHKEIMTGFNVQ